MAGKRRDIRKVLTVINTGKGDVQSVVHSIHEFARARNIETLSLDFADRRRPEELDEQRVQLAQLGPLGDAEDTAQDHVERDLLHVRVQRERLTHRPAGDGLVGDVAHDLGVGVHPFAVERREQELALAHVRLVKRTVWSLAEAREALERLIGRSSDWARLDEYLISFVVEPSLAATVFASSFASTLELVREGAMEVHQQAAFAPLYVRKRQQPENGATDPGGGKLAIDLEPFVVARIDVRE